ncbi:MAG: hypothetical protein IT285_00440 [Bdellovibrionales bacterium]|nr:hypothetical protein [Bdellovibrionales bacterium]
MRSVKFLADALILAACAAFAAACAPDHGNILAGTWELSHYLCDGEREELPAGYRLRLLYGADGSFTTRLTDTLSPCDIDINGSYEREGLDVRETVTEIVCPGVCTVPAAGESGAVACAGAGTVPITGGNDTHDLLLNVDAVDVMSSTRHSPAQYCTDGDIEEQVFTRVD